jgi:branched-chain amino acid transport system substrate-binding protein
MNGALVSWETFVPTGDSAPVKEYRSVVGRQAPSQVDTVQATLGWVSAKLFGQVAANLPSSPTAADVLAGLYKIKNDTIDGLVPEPVTFTKGTGAPFLGACEVFSHISNLQIVPDSGPPVCSK